MSTSTVSSAAGQPSVSQVPLSRPAPGIIAALFFGYLAVGLPLPVLPIFIHERLGFSSLVVGLVIGIQFVATLWTRGHAGRMVDQRGGKRAALQGATISAVAGLCYLVATVPALSPAARLAVIVAGRLVAGIGESLFVTGCVSWSIASVGQQRAGLSMSWTGIAMFAALSIGAPIGMLLYQQHGLTAVMFACIAAPLVSAAVAFLAPTFVSLAGPRLPFVQVVRQIWREGFGLALQGVGLAALTTFASLYFSARGWGHAGWVMSFFWVGFIVTRIAFGQWPDRIGGYRVAFWSFVVEAIGQSMLWLAPNEGVALAGALVTGLGCALIYPALGVEALTRVLPANRGSAMGAFTAFLDIAYGLAGPVAGWVAGHLGYAAVFLLGAVCALAGLALVLISQKASRLPPSNPTPNRAALH